MINRKLVHKLLIFIYETYREKNGDSISRLKFERYRVDDPLFISLVRDACEDSAATNADSLLYAMLSDLHDMGYIKLQNMQFKLLQPGVYEAIRLKRPILFFLIKHWKWYIPIIIGVAITMLNK